MAHEATLYPLTGFTLKSLGFFTMLDTTDNSTQDEFQTTQNKFRKLRKHRGGGVGGGYVAHPSITWEAPQCKLGGKSV